MASRKKNLAIVDALGSAEALDKAIDESDKYLAVVDVHQGWCGPCGVMEPVMRKIKLGNERLLVKFYTLDESLMTPAQKAPLPNHGVCKPIFLLYKNKVLVGKIAGVNAPELETQVVDNANEAVEEE